MRKKTVESMPACSRQLIEQLRRISTDTGSENIARRATIVLMAIEGIPNSEIAAKCDLHYNNVSIWCDRFRKGFDRLQKTEAEQGNLDSVIRDLLSDRRRPGPPPRFSPGQVEKIVALSRRNPADYGYEQADHWSLYLLTAEAIRQGIVDEISPATVRRFLREAEN